ncbi:MAG: hypothetical protein AB2696_17460 [Candidatus Thiodiazotropha sp.]
MDRKSLQLLGIGLAGALLTAWAFPTFSIIALDETSPAEVGQVFLGLIFVALIFERATEVYVNVQLKPGKRQILEPVAKIQVKVRQARAALHAEQQSPSPNRSSISGLEAHLSTAINELEQQAQNVIPQLQKHRDIASIHTSTLSVALGVLAGVVGIRALGPFLEECQLANCTMGQWMRTPSKRLSVHLKKPLSENV